MLSLHLRRVRTRKNAWDIHWSKEKRSLQGRPSSVVSTYKGLNKWLEGFFQISRTICALFSWQYSHSGLHNMRGTLLSTIGLALENLSTGVKGSLCVICQLFWFSYLCQMSPFLVFTKYSHVPLSHSLLGCQAILLYHKKRLISNLKTF